MDIANILSELRGKVLDAAHFDMLKHAYDLQTQNIDQLKNNNEALKESNDLFKDKVRHLEAENNKLKETIEDLNKKLKEGHSSSTSLSEVSMAILDFYIKHDSTHLYNEQIISGLSYSRIEVEAGISELSKEKILSMSGATVGSGLNYGLTPKGKQFVVNINK